MNKYGKVENVLRLLGGYPSIQDTTQRMLSAINADVIEIEIPFSDPIGNSSGASSHALSAGCNVDKLFDMLNSVQGQLSAAVVLVTYANPVFAYGITNFALRCKNCGVSGVLLQDVPHEEAAEFEVEFTASGIDIIKQLGQCDAGRAQQIILSAKGYYIKVQAPGEGGRLQRVLVEG